MTFARFMELALYHPERGYYRNAAARPGRDGDFLTAPEAHPIFGQAVARLAIDVWSRAGTPGDVHDPRARRRLRGAGGGARRRRPGGRARRSLDALRYRAGGGRAASRSRTLAARASATSSNRTTTAPIDGLVIANEVLDALPVHRVVGTARGLDEVYVAIVDGSLADVQRAAVDAGARRRASTPRASRSPRASGPRSASRPTPGSRALPAASRGPRCCSSTTATRRPRSTTTGAARAEPWRAYVSHRVHDDPYRAIGRQDLTAHVDVTAVEAAASAAGLEHVATTTQAGSSPGSGWRPARRAAVRPGRGPGGLPRREGVARPDARPGGDGRVRASWPSAAACRSMRRSRGPDRHRSRTPPDHTGLRRSPYRHALRRTRRLRSPMGPAVVRVVVHRRGTDRELARALGAIRPPPTSAAPSQGHSAGGRGR